MFQFSDFFSLSPLRPSGVVASHPSLFLALNLFFSLLSFLPSLLHLSLNSSPLQAIVITDPALATHVCRSKLLDKFRFQYHFMDEVNI